MSTSEIFAQPMIDTKEYMKECVKQLVELHNQGVLPDLNAKLKYSVYSIRESRFGGHKSIVLTTNDNHFVSVELGFIEIDGTRRIFPVTRNIDQNMRSKMEFHGYVTTTGITLIAKALAVMKHFGNYFKLWKNCQNFCNMYLEAIGLQLAQTLTDADKVGIAALIASFISAITLAL